MLKVNASRRGLFPHAISVNPFDDSLIAVFGKYVKLDVVSLREDNEAYLPSNTLDLSSNFFNGSIPMYLIQLS
ncbi:hypothetical protein Tco_0102789 [Tanacetum coccineum]